MLLYIQIMFALFGDSAFGMGSNDMNHVHHICNRAAYLSNVHTHHADREDHLNLALCFHRNNLITEALEVYSEIRNTHGDYAFPLVNIAHIQYMNGEYEEAIDTINTYFGEVGADFPFQNGGEIQSDNDSIEHGSPCVEDALFRVDCVSALNIFGLSHMSLLEYTTALKAYEKAIEIGNRTFIISDVQDNLGSLQYLIGYDVKARDSFLKSFESAMLYGDNINAEPLVSRAMLIPSITGSLEEAAGILRSFHNNLDCLLALIDSGGLGVIERAQSSNLFETEDMSLEADFFREIPPLIQASSSSLQNSLLHFHLQYYGFNDREVLERVASIFQRLSPLPLMVESESLRFYQPPEIVSGDITTKKAKNIATPEHQNGSHDHSSSPPREKIRIVFVSCLFGGNEPHGQLVLDVIKSLPSRIFESVAVSVGLKLPLPNFIEAVNGKVFSVGRDKEKGREVISSQRPDCVVFVENINNGIMHFLAYERFAPVQILLMGAPITGGIPSIDYFLSGDRLEHPFRTQISGDLSHVEPYSEQVVLFDGQALSFPQNQIHSKQDIGLAAGEAVSSFSLLNDTGMSYDEFNLPLVDGKSLYFCFQSLFKITPVFDSVISKILHGDPHGHFILQASRSSQKNRAAKERIKAFIIDDACQGSSGICESAKDVLSRIHFIPRVKSDQLQMLFQRATVALHPFPFDGSKTASDILGSDVPLVIFPQRYLKGRLAETFYASMAMHEIDSEVAASKCCVANDIGDYISKVLRLGTDPQYRNRVASAIHKRKSRIYDDRETSFEWALFLTRSLGVSITREELALEMEFSPTDWQTEQFHQKVIQSQQSRWKRKKIEQFILSQ